MKEYTHEYADIRMQVPSDLQRSAGLYVLRSGFNRAKPGYDVGPKRIECYSFHFILKGKLCLEDEENSHELQEGQLFVLFPHVSYRYYKAESSPELSLSWIAMGGPQTSAAVEALGLTQSRPSMSIRFNAELRILLRRIHTSMGGRPYQQLSNVYALLDLLLLGCEQSSGHQLTMSAVNPQKNGHMPHKEPITEVEQHKGETSVQALWLDYCARYMQLHYAEPLRIDNLAAEVSVHRSHFSFAFRERFGMPPKAYLTKLRMTKAHELVTTDREAPIHEIALTVGYPDLFTFTRAFSRYYGISPSDARRQQE
ncbi:MULTISPECIES: AraC family transcriptional regulator [Paenibacillus]|uniref:AraC family transcriptional regulator n=1 Tax=Paenibacillus TaxID=44249 RepID=UPI0001AFD961|nr:MULTISPECIES: AraC family transcriptional regulator [unclassified Paenibacillus]EES72576.1 transcriptional regulator, AraC family [Paenibacillus sp. oral taxon 786 str. D14]OXL87518.1 hypothetical protein BCV73_34030 [Paenibacillus sp. SSG-1]